MLYTAGVTVVFFCLISTFFNDITGTFNVIKYDTQYKDFGSVWRFTAASVGQCAVGCTLLGNRCGSFSFTNSKLCSINSLQLLPNQVTRVESGSMVYSKQTSAPKPGESFNKAPS